MNPQHHSQSKESDKPALRVRMFPQLVRSRNLVDLMTVRLLVKLKGWRENAGEILAGIFPKLHCQMELQTRSSEFSESNLAHYESCLKATLQRMELRRDQYVWPATLRKNLDLIRSEFGLSGDECTVLGLAIALRAFEEFGQLASDSARPHSPIHQIAMITGLPESKIRSAFSANGNLVRLNLVSLDYAYSLDSNVTLGHQAMRMMASRRMKSLDEFMRGVFKKAPPSMLDMGKYQHLKSKLDLLKLLLREAFDHGRKGVNILLYGPPGTGKTELCRLLSQEIGVCAYELSASDESGERLNGIKRLGNLATAHRLLGNQRALLVFDEIDAVFKDGSSFTGRLTTAESAKAWVNDLLETSPVPTFWIANEAWHMDPAFVRRFDLVIEMRSPPLAQRLELLRQEFQGLLDEHELKCLAKVESITPAVVTRVASAVKRVDLKPSSAFPMVRAMFDGVLKVQGHRGLPVGINRHETRFDPSLSQASINLEALAEGLAFNGSGRLCLYGPPGTGKTAFGHWLAERLGRTLVVKRISDLQSPFVGVMEQNLAREFERASEEGSILQIDEVDSYLRDRNHARARWEVSQVNEFLTQLESFDGIFIASTNLMHGLDPAALRRFDWKIAFHYLPLGTAARMLEGYVQRWFPDMKVTRGELLERLKEVDQITPGDFAVVDRRHRVAPWSNLEEAINALACECAHKSGPSRRIGFV